MAVNNIFTNKAVLYGLTFVFFLCFFFFLGSKAGFRWGLLNVIIYIILLYILVAITTVIIMLSSAQCSKANCFSSLAAPPLIFLALGFASSLNEFKSFLNYEVYNIPIFFIMTYASILIPCKYAIDGFYVEKNTERKNKFSEMQKNIFVISLIAFLAYTLVSLTINLIANAFMANLHWQATIIISSIISLLLMFLIFNYIWKIYSYNSFKYPLLSLLITIILNKITLLYMPLKGLDKIELVLSVASPPSPVYIFVMAIAIQLYIKAKDKNIEK